MQSTLTGCHLRTTLVHGALWGMCLLCNRTLEVKLLDTVVDLPSTRSPG